MNCKKCNECGSFEIKEGILSGARIVPNENRIRVSGSEIVIYYCDDCGNILGARIADPQKLKKNTSDAAALGSTYKMLFNQIKKR